MSAELALEGQIEEPKPNGNGHADETPGRKSVLVTMAERYGMDYRAFEPTVRAQCSPPGVTLSREEFGAFILVANEYELNPLTREIYAFPRKGGGIVPIVSVDGWVSLVNRHQAFDGIEFDMNESEKGELVSCTCRIYRKDRSRPIEVTEYFSECFRPTDPWKMKHRMLRHKSLIQCARYAFGFSGIYDEDEGRVIAEARDITPAPEPAAAPPPGVLEGLEGKEPLPVETPRTGAPKGTPRASTPYVLGKEPSLEDELGEIPAFLDRREGAVDAEVVE